ncbi:MAG: hypothetical protein COB12_13405 [Flavobacterium sp.]|nr:MAG: hypothetical protein COB12_13405 [Flavobacterium sp.]
MKNKLNMNYEIKLKYHPLLMELLKLHISVKYEENANYSNESLLAEINYMIDNEMWYEIVEMLLVEAVNNPARFEGEKMEFLSKITPPPSNINCE